MPAWHDQITDKYVANVANAFITEVGIDAFSIFPKVTTRQLSGYIAQYNKEDFFYIGDIQKYKLAGSTESVGDEYRVGKQSYVVEKYAFHKDVSEDERNEYDNPFDPVSDATHYVVHRLKRVLLYNLVSTYMTTGVWDTDTNLTSVKWNAKTGATSTNDPVKKVMDLCDNIAKVTGFRPNRMIMAQNVYSALKTNSFITERMKNTNDKVVTIDLLARLFELDTIKVLGDVNSAADDFMVSGAALLCYTPDRPSKMKPSAGYHIVYTRSPKKDLVGTRRLPMEHLNNSLRIEGWMHFEAKALATSLGNYIYNIV